VLKVKSAMKGSSVVLALTTVVATTVAAAIMHGSMTGRWGQAEVLATAGAKLLEVPDQFGKWRLHSSQTFSEAELNELECAGHFVRTYQHADTGAIVSVTMIVGPAMPTSLHTPEVCFASREFKRLEGFPQTKQLSGADGSENAFLHSVFRSNRGGGIVEFYYAWSTGGPWRVPKTDPRLEFVGEPFLYKIQVSRSLPGSAGGETDAVIRDFLTEFIGLAKGYILATRPK